MAMTTEALAKKMNITPEEAAEKLKEKEAKRMKLKAKKAMLPERNYDDIEVPDIQAHYDAYAEKLQEAEYTNDALEKNVEPQFHDIEMNNITIKFVKKAKEVGACFKTITGQNAYLISKQKSVTLYNVRMLFENNVVFNFSVGKSLTGIGKTKACAYYDLLYSNMEEYGIIPSYEGIDFKTKFNKFVRELRMADAEVREVTNSYDWQKSDAPEEIPEPVPLKTWAEVSESIEEFNDETEEKAFKLIWNEGLIDKMLDVAELKVVKQRNKIGLTILISMSSFMNTSVHNITTGPPGIGKSSIMDVVFDMFPKQCRESIGKSSTPASLLNMTKYAEGSKVLSKKLVRLGDLGNEEELKNAGPILGILREVMSEGHYDKNVTDISNDQNKAQKLRLEGIGSVQLSTIEKDMEAQFSSRAIISSPDDNPEIAKAIREFQLDDFQKMMNDVQYKKERPVIACAISKISKEIELYEEHGTVSIINPYNAVMEEIFNIGKAKNVNRSRQQVIELPKSVILCNIKNREKFVNAELSKIVVVMTPADFIYALKIIGKPIKEMLSDISPQQQSFVRYIEENHMYKADGTKLDFKTFEDFWNMEVKTNDEDWIAAEITEPCFTLKKIRMVLNTGETTTREVLEELVNEGVIYKKLIGRRNVYFPTEEFKKYIPELTKAIMTDEEFDKLKEKVQALYDAAVRRLDSAGFENKGKHFPLA